MFVVFAPKISSATITIDRVTVKQEADRIFHTVTTYDNLETCPKSNPEDNVFATDAILATLS